MDRNILANISKTQVAFRCIYCRSEKPRRGKPQPLSCRLWYTYPSIQLRKIKECRRPKDKIKLGHKRCKLYGSAERNRSSAVLFVPLGKALGSSNLCAEMKCRHSETLLLFQLSLTGPTTKSWVRHWVLLNQTAGTSFSVFAPGSWKQRNCLASFHFLSALFLEFSPKKQQEKKQYWSLGFI